MPLGGPSSAVLLKISEGSEERVKARTLQFLVKHGLAQAKPGVAFEHAQTTSRSLKNVGPKSWALLRRIASIALLIAVAGVFAPSSYGRIGVSDDDFIPKLRVVIDQGSVAGHDWNILAYRRILPAKDWTTVKPGKGIESRPSPCFEMNAETTFGSKGYLACGRPAPVEVRRVELGPRNARASIFFTASRLKVTRVAFRTRAGGTLSVRPSVMPLAKSRQGHVKPNFRFAVLTVPRFVDLCRAEAFGHLGRHIWSKSLPKCHGELPAPARSSAAFRRILHGLADSRVPSMRG